ncbi:MAG: hypothetical protein KKE02_16770 [Alphaproteobacteria bacterium]|nr:hypothetical protein [Alphaproteobacteria bacterium]MBU1516694.1 hypothetical protein [Alphaproteobacteria bacterium]MBU2094450.1 hypothetical protein [Alphaproteobacteria bacterium]MBU2152677.1 hypothetical protein [Alphaproteobacteria bacterium]MBU2306169.1 hypothetical protein [Alphaproteobacteria bacterium]
MKTPTVASLKKVTPENLARLGAERLAAIVAEAAETRPDLKRRLRMELAAEQGADHLALELDKRLTTLEGSRSKVSWRKRPAFVSDLEILRALIADRLAELDPVAALARMWPFMDLARRLGSRVKDKDGGVAATFDRAAEDIGRLLGQRGDARAIDGLVEAIARNPTAWADWLPAALAPAPKPALEMLLARLRDRQVNSPGWAAILRQVADASGDVDAFLGTFTAQAVRTPVIAAEAAQRLLGAGRVAEAGRLLEASAKLGASDVAWEGAWIDYLEAAGQPDTAQAARWASFERTLSAERARAFTRRLPDFEDVEAENRAFDHAARHPDTQLGLQFLMEWPAFPEAATMIEARADDLQIPAEQAELWAGKLRARQPRAAHTLLRKTAAAAFRRRDFATCDRLTEEADTIEVD